MGRDDVLAGLRARLEGPRRGGLVQVAGEAGMGKSRLVRELAAAAGVRGWVVIEGRASPFDAALPLGVLQDALRADRRARPDAPLPDDPLAAAFPAMVLPEMAGPGGRDQDRAVLFEAAARFLRAVAGADGLLLVLEDLHWADPTSQALVASLARALAGAPVLMAVTYRTPFAEPGTGLEVLRRELARERLGEEVVLGRLAPECVDGMVDDMIGRPASAEAHRRIDEMSGGVPFVVEELVREAVAAGDLDPQSGRWAGGRPRVPWTVQEMALAPVRRLPERDGELVRWAAVLGERFDLRLLAAASGTPEAEVIEALGRMRAAGLVAEDEADPGGMRFAFRHAITRDAALAGLVTADLRRRHAAVLDAAERAGVPVPLEELVGHAIAAGDRARGFSSSREAARRAQRLGGYAEARAHLERAVALWAPALGAEARAEALLDLGEHLMRTAPADGAAGVIDQARVAFAALGDHRERVAQALAADVRLSLGERGEPLALMHEARLALPAAAPLAARLRVWSVHARGLLVAGVLEECMEVARQGLAIAGDAPGHEVAVLRVHLLTTLGTALWGAGMREEGRARLLDSLARARALDDPIEVLRAQNNLVVSMIADPASSLDALAPLAEAADLAVTHGLRRYATHARHLRATVHRERGELEAAADGDPGATDPLDALEQVVQDADHLLALGRADAALAAFLEAIPAIEEVGDPQHDLDLVRRWAADAALAAGRLDEASRLLALVPARAGGPDVYWPASARARLAATTGDAAAARRWADVALAVPGVPAAGALEACAALAAGCAPDLAPARASVDALDRLSRRREAMTWPAYLALAAVRVPPAAGAAAELAAVARERARAMGADGWAERMEGVLRALGRRAPTRRAAPAGAGDLTGREAQVLALLAEGATNRGIAARLVISEATAARHVANIFAKLGVHSRAAAARVAAERGLAPPPT